MNPETVSHSGWWYSLLSNSVCSRVRPKFGHIPVPALESCVNLTKYWPSLTLKFPSCEKKQWQWPPHKKVMGIKWGDAYKALSPLPGQQKIVRVRGHCYCLYCLWVSITTIIPIIIRIPVHHLLLHHCPLWLPSSPLSPSSLSFWVFMGEILQGDRHQLCCSIGQFFCEQILNITI